MWLIDFLKLMGIVLYVNYHQSLQYFKNDIDILIGIAVIYTKNEKINKDIRKTVLYKDTNKSCKQAGSALIYLFQNMNWI